jgi:hypothetical protein
LKVLFSLLYNINPMVDLVGEAANAEVHNAQRKPDAWDNLLDFAHDHLEPTKPYEEQGEAVAALWEQTHTLDAEVYEANRYYGLGLITCALARSMQGETAREEFIERGTWKLAGSHVGYCVGSYYYPAHMGLYAKEIRDSDLVDKEMLRDEYAKLSDAERLVANTLSAWTPGGGSTRLMSPGSHHRKRILDQEPALEAVVSNTFAGTSLILRTTLQRIHERQQGKKWPPDFAKSKFNPLLADFVSEADLLALDLKRVAFIAASIRLDEMLNIVPRLLTLDESGNPDIDRSLIPASPLPVAKGAGDLPFTHHTARLGCPALYVAGAIPTATQLLPEIVVRAQKDLLAGKFGANRRMSSRELLEIFLHQRRAFSD